MLQTPTISPTVRLTSSFVNAIFEVAHLVDAGRFGRRKRIQARQIAVWCLAEIGVSESDIAFGYGRTEENIHHTIAAVNRARESEADRRLTDAVLRAVRTAVDITKGGV